MAKHPADHELDFLKCCTKEELTPIVAAVLGTKKKVDLEGRVIVRDGIEEREIDTKGRFSSSLDKRKVFKENYPDHTKYVDELIDEIQRYGGNSIFNAFRGHGVLYHDVLVDVANKQRVHFDKLQPTEEIEMSLLEKILENVWEKMSDSQRQSVLDEAAKQGFNVNGIGLVTLVAILEGGGVGYYWVLRFITILIGRTLLGCGFVAGGSLVLMRFLGLLAGPIGWVVSGAWMALDCASPAYRVTIPATIYIAALRRIKLEQKLHPEY